MKILLIEDDASLVSALKIGLTGEGYTVDAIADGESAKKRFKMYGNVYDLAIMDLGLPNVSGYDLCQFVRENDIKIPILILTGRTSVQEKVEVLNLGADDYVTKPFAIEELIARIRALLRRPQEVHSNIIVAGNIALDTSKRIATYFGKEIALSLKEFGVLEYLMHRPNQVVLRDEILDHVWDFNYSSLSNIIDVHINRLRSKLKVKRGEILETVRGVGYRLKI